MIGLALQMICSTSGVFNLGSEDPWGRSGRQGPEGAHEQANK